MQESGRNFRTSNNCVCILEINHPSPSKSFLFRSAACTVVKSSRLQFKTILILQMHQQFPYDLGFNDIIIIIISLLLLIYVPESIAECFIQYPWSMEMFIANGNIQQLSLRAVVLDTKPTQILVWRTYLSLAHFKVCA